MTKVYVYPADRSGCAWYRMILPGRTLLGAGYDVTVHEVGSDGVLEAALIGNKLVGLTVMPDCDVAVIQRPLHWTRIPVIKLLQSRGIFVIGEIDDDFSAVHPEHAAYRGFHPRHSPGHNWDICAEALGLCDRLVVSTPALAERYAKPGQDVVIMPNTLPPEFVIPESRIHEPLDPTQVVVGWAGKVDSHPRDLEATDQGVGRLQRTLGFQMKVVGSAAGVKRGLALAREPLLHRWAPYAEYPGAISTFDVGIAPLRPSKFNEAKSALKPLEYAARGVPFVCSPSGPYADFVAQGAGRLALSREQWAARVREYVVDDRRRTEDAAKGLEVARRWTINRHVDAWASAWMLDA